VELPILLRFQRKVNCQLQLIRYPWANNLPVEVVSEHRQSEKDLVVSADSSVDVPFGPTAPQRHESNWVQTVPGKGWNLLFRLYGPLEPWVDKTWRPGEFELVK
jgi:hypothetical protein